jgi:hypothetical protein
MVDPASWPKRRDGDRISGPTNRRTTRRSSSRTTAGGVHRRLWPTEKKKENTLHGKELIRSNASRTRLLQKLGPCAAQRRLSSRLHRARVSQRDHPAGYGGGRAGGLPRHADWIRPTRHPHPTWPICTLARSGPSRYIRAPRQRTPPSAT